MLKKFLVSVALGATMASGSVSATTFGFGASPDVFIYSYQGFNWSGGYGSGSWVNGTVSPLWGAVPAAPLGYAWSNGGTNLSMELASGGSFTFNSIALYADTRIWGGSPTSVTIEGWSAGTLVNTFTTPVLDSLPRGAFQNFVFNWSNVDAVKFKDAPFQNVLLTSVSVNNPVSSVPEPESYAMMLAGLALMGAIARRRKAKHG
jgi:hypothetical protein